MSVIINRFVELVRTMAGDSAFHRFRQPCDFSAEGAGQYQISGIRPTCAKDGRKGVLTDKSSSCSAYETVFAQHIIEFHKSIVEIPVSIDHDRNSKGSVTLDGCQPRFYQVRHSADIDRHGKDYQIVFAEFNACRPGLRRRHIVAKKGTSACAAEAAAMATATFPVVPVALNNKE
jgi:hypothetical protein